MAISFKDVEDWRELNKSAFGLMSFLSNRVKPAFEDPICKDPAFPLLLRASLEFSPKPTLHRIWMKNFNIPELADSEVVQHAKLHYLLSQHGYIFNADTRTVDKADRVWCIDNVFDRKSDCYLRYQFFECGKELIYTALAFDIAIDRHRAKLPKNEHSNLKPSAPSSYFIYHLMYKGELATSMKTFRLLQEAPIELKTAALCLDADEFPKRCQELGGLDGDHTRTQILANMAGVSTDEIKKVINLDMGMDSVDIVNLCRSSCFKNEIEAQPLPTLEINV